ncbi:MAG TPA: glycosyltransferase [Thermoanaerobaculia bacterium]|jgi:hopene-associated glycosyltransferase HpnB|nr:glycosyltransferase [Thermoanaerobaculia bacterium]
MTILAAAAALIAAFWLTLALSRLRRFPRDHFLRKVAETRTTPAAAPRVAVLVPARDEAAMLPLTLPSLLAQEYPDFEVLLVDDGSTDGTADVAAAAARNLGARSAPFRVIAAGDKPAGWAGKMYALQRGIDTVFSDSGGSPPTWILLTDADIRHPPTSIASLIAKAQRGGYDLVSVMARLSTESAWEKLLIPPFVYFFHLLYPFRAVSLRSEPSAAAAGGCVLVRAKALVDAGGFDAIHGALIDDVALARLLKSRRRRLWLGLDPEIESVRRYSFRDLWRMVARSAFVQLGYRYGSVPLVMLGLAFFFAGPSIVVPTSVAVLLLGVRTPAVWVALACGATARLLETLAILPWVRHHRIRHPIAWSLTFPLAALLYGAMTVGSAWEHLRGRGSAWKGRGYEPPSAGAAVGRTRNGADTFTP